MKRLILSITCMLFMSIAVAQEVTYAPTTKKYTSAELNAMTTETLIALKNLSRTNNYWFYGNTGATPYSKQAFANEAVFVWTPVQKGVAGAYHLKKLNGTYMQKSSPKDFGTIDNAAVFTTTNPTSKGSGASNFNGDGDSQSYINGSDDSNLVRFVKDDNTWVNVQNGDSGTPLYNTGTGGWTIHYAYEVKPASEPVEGEGKVYLISWKNTGANYITEEPDGRMTVQGKDVTKQQFWMFIPTENENCFYIKNTATGNYLGSCNLTPSSDSKVQTSIQPVEYYMAKTAATSGENANCWYFSSTDCDNYSNESSNPRALNKDGASNYVITWNAGTDKVGSYWTLVETEDLYELRPFAISNAIGNIGASYNVQTPSGKNLTFADNKPSMATPDSFDENQEWYFVGTNDGKGFQIASASEPATVIGINDGNIIAGENLETKWKVKKGEINGYYYFTSNNTTLKVDSDSLFRFTRVRSAYSRTLKIYNNPCGATGNIYAKRAEIRGEGAVDNIIYESNSKPGNWHIMYAMDKGEVIKGEKFNIDVTLSENATNALTAIAHFDWNSDGVFETAVPLTLNGTKGNAEATVPEWAEETQTRMRLRINSNGLDLAEDDVYGFIYDFHIKVVKAEENRTATVAVNADDRGSATLSEVAENYAYGTTLTAKAVPTGNAQFVCWREEGVVVSTNAEYTFTVDHNVKLVAYFTPNTTGTTGVKSVVADEDIVFTLQNNKITAIGNCDITSMTLYTIDAAIVARNTGNTIDTAELCEGVYIVCAKTENGYKNSKIYLRK
ncbi:MAG: hypothetical protein J6V20_07770 [Bacteroidaceae bacterium]|nr:hypothetical protein [Bacteroidaceae bacterium]